MSDLFPDQTLLANLQTLTENPVVPADVKAQGKRLLKRLQFPVRTLITGLPGCGKSEIMNVLAGQQVIRSGSHHPDIRLFWSETAQTEVTGHDGSKTVLDGNAIGNGVASDATRAKVGLALPMLKHTTLLETRFDIQSGDRRTVSKQIANSAEIIVWCTERFTPREQEFWRQMPDKVKDHSFLVLTKADVLAAEGTLQSTLETLAETAGEDFYSLIPVAALQANSARNEDGSVDDDVLNGSGGKSLINAVMHQAAEGRMADADNARLFVRKYASYTRSSAPAPVPAPSPKPETQATPTTKIVDTPSDPSSLRQAEPVPQPTDPFAPALKNLRERASELMQFSEKPGPESTKATLAHCIETTSQLVDIFDDINNPTPVISTIQDTLIEATDTIVLMQLEKDADAAADAATILLQIKRDLAAGMAA